jgi:transposase-like protein
MPEFIKNTYMRGYCSFRRIEKLFRSIYCRSPTHQTIYNWIEKLSSKPMADANSNNSGYYCYDEQYLRFNGKRYYILSLIDSILNKPIAEEIANNLEYNTVKSFIKRTISGKAIYAITTDHRRK